MTPKFTFKILKFYLHCGVQFLTSNQISLYLGKLTLNNLYPTLIDIFLNNLNINILHKCKESRYAYRLLKVEST
jgi:hypothetical protein